MLQTMRGPALAGLLLLILGAALAPRPASAHANLLQSDPPAQSALSRAPAQVQLLFSESIEPSQLEVSVLDSERRAVDSGDGRLLPGTDDTVVLSLGDLEPGVYTISWKVLSAVDGHVTRGLVPFSVGDAGTAPAPLSAEEIGQATSGEAGIQRGPLGIAARWLVLLSILALGGLFTAMPLLLGPVAARLELMRSGQDDAAVTDDAPERVLGETLRRVFRVMGVALVAMLAGGVVLYLVDAAATAGVSFFAAIGSPAVELAGTRRGGFLLARLALGIVLAALVLSSPLRSGRISRPLWVGGAALAAGMLLLTSMSSHSAALRSWTALAVALDWVHLVAAALWVGGLIFLGVALLPSLGPLGGPARTRLLAALVPRFSRIAGPSVAIVVLTGLYQTVRLLGGWSALTELTWGRALLVKVGLVLLLIGLGAFNLLVVGPRMGRYARAMDRLTRERAAALRGSFRRAVLAEVSIAALVVLAVGVLTGVTPSEARISTPEGPFRPFVLDARAEELSGRLLLSPGRIGANRFDLTVQGAAGGRLPEGAEAVLRITTLDQDTGTSETRMESLGAGRFTAAGTYLSTVGLWEVTALIRRPGMDEVPLPFRLSLTEATGRPQVEEQRPAAPLARGREIYTQNCINCHGQGGRGDGPLAAGLRPPPLDLTVHVPLHGDSELTNWIANGVPRTAMPAWGSQFSPEEIQAVINYLRELAKQSTDDR